MHNDTDNVEYYNSRHTKTLTTTNICITQKEKYIYIIEKKNHNVNWNLTGVLVFTIWGPISKICILSVTNNNSGAYVTSHVISVIIHVVMMVQCILQKRNRVTCTAHMCQSQLFCFDSIHCSLRFSSEKFPLSV